MGTALGIAQFGGIAPAAKPWKGLGPGVLEVVESHDGNAYRAVYTVRFEKAIYVLHAFQKKSPSGIRTAKRDVESHRGTSEDRRAGSRGALWQVETLNEENRSLVALETYSQISGFPMLPSGRPGCA
jgi:phage-related protein